MTRLNWPIRIRHSLRRLAFCLPWLQCSMMTRLNYLFRSLGNCSCSCIAYVDGHTIEPRHTRIDLKVPEIDWATAFLGDRHGYVLSKHFLGIPAPAIRLLRNWMMEIQLSGDYNTSWHQAIRRGGVTVPGFIAKRWSCMDFHNKCRSSSTVKALQTQALHGIILLLSITSTHVVDIGPCIMPMRDFSFSNTGSTGSKAV